MNCTGKRCLVQYNKVDPATCTAVPYCPQATPPKTNADRIRAMSDGELAEWMCTEYRKIPWCRSDNEEDIESGKCRPQVCIICANVWLKEEVGDVT